MNNDETPNVSESTPAPEAGGDKLDRILNLVETIHADEVENRNRIERLEQALKNRPRLALDETDDPLAYQGEGEDPLAKYGDLTQLSLEQAAEIARKPWQLFLRKGSTVMRGDRRIDGPKTNIGCEDLESAYSEKHKYQEIAEIERQARVVKHTRQRHAAAAEAKGQPLAYHWGPKWLAAEPIRPKGLVGANAG